MTLRLVGRVVSGKWSGPLVAKTSEERVTTKLREEIHASEERLTKKMESELEDTIDVLKELIHTGYTMLEQRIKHLEDQAEQPHKN